MDVSNANKKSFSDWSGRVRGISFSRIVGSKWVQSRALVQYNSYNNNWGWMEAVDCINDVEVIAGDIRDQDCCNSIMKNIDIVFI